MDVGLTLQVSERLDQIADEMVPAEGLEPPTP
jgi:hypothetical protein